MGSLRILGLTLAVVLSLSAAAASIASAASEFTAEDLPLAISGEQAEGSHVITLEDEKKLICESATFTGVLAQPSATMTVSPSYSSCTFAGASASVSVNSCTYQLNSGEELSETSFEGTMDVVCPEGQKIVVTTSNCEIQIGTQSGVGKLEFVDNPEAEPKPTFTVNTSITNLKYNKIKDEKECPLTETGEKENGAYSGHMLVKGSKAGEPVGLAVKKQVKVTLCKEDPGKAACGNAYPAKTSVEGSITAVTEFVHGGVQVTCTTSKLTAANKAVSEAPLNLENFSVTFTGCKENTMNCTNVKMVSTPAPTAAIYLWGGGNGFILATAAIIFECPGFTCQFGSSTLTMVLFGGMAPDVVVVAQSLGKQKLTGEKNCEGAITWTTAKYPLNSPKPVWVSK